MEEREIIIEEKEGLGLGLHDFLDEFKKHWIFLLVVTLAFTVLGACYGLLFVKDENSAANSFYIDITPIELGVDVSDTKDADTAQAVASYLMNKQSTEYNNAMRELTYVNSVVLTSVFQNKAVDLYNEKYNKQYKETGNEELKLSMRTFKKNFWCSVSESLVMTITYTANADNSEDIIKAVTEVINDGFKADTCTYTYGGGKLHEITGSTSVTVKHEGAKSLKYGLIFLAVGAILAVIAEILKVIISAQLKKEKEREDKVD